MGLHLIPVSLGCDWCPDDSACVASGCLCLRCWLISNHCLCVLRDLHGPSSPRLMWLIRANSGCFPKHTTGENRGARCCDKCAVCAFHTPTSTNTHSPLVCAASFPVLQFHHIVNACEEAAREKIDQICPTTSTTSSKMLMIV